MSFTAIIARSKCLFFYIWESGFASERSPDLCLPIMLESGSSARQVAGRPFLIITASLHIVKHHYNNSDSRHFVCEPINQSTLLSNCPVYFSDSLSLSLSLFTTISYLAFNHPELYYLGSSLSSTAPMAIPGGSVVGRSSM